MIDGDIEAAVGFGVKESVETEGFQLGNLLIWRIVDLLILENGEFENLKMTSKR
jgi:hypothetical protein